MSGGRGGGWCGQAYGKDDSEYNLSISRYELNVFLINQAEKAGVPASPRLVAGSSLPK